jgi:hypothetical protein
MRPTLMALEDRRLLSTYTVNSIGDSGSGRGLVGDLRYCITQANSAGGNETIRFDSTVFKTPQTIPLSGTQLELSDTTGTETIVGPKQGVTVSGNGMSRVFQVDKGVTASISGLTITDGETAGAGGGVYNDGGNLTLTNSNISGNSSTGYILSGDAGGVFSGGGTTTLTSCTISGNDCTIYGAGGVGANGGALSLTNCNVIGNSNGYGGGPGGVGSYKGTLSLTNCNVSGNHSGGGGGGLNTYLSTVNLTNCTVSGNSAGTCGGGLFSLKDTLSLTNCTISGNSVGAHGSNLLYSQNVVKVNEPHPSDP